ncbi:MAG: adenylyltransferase/cytidyltransferase family protein, partial [Candidatus Sumerlaeota bacterium]
MRLFESKILTREEAAEQCRVHRDKGHIIGFTSGAFDLVHAGHVEYLQKAREQCDLLVVAVNSDASVKSYKGPHRPIVPQEQRAATIAALESVDLVFLFDERRNAQNIEAIKPHLYIKAGDYKKSGLTSSEVVEKHGGKAVLVDIETPVSTTAILHKAIESLRAEGKIDAAPMPSSAKPDRSPDDPGITAAGVELPAPPLKMAPAAFLDRDGTINEDVG